MRILLLVILFFACAVGISSAQTNVSTNAVNAILALVTTNAPPPATNPPAPGSPEDVFKTARGPISIHSDGPADFDLNRHWTTYRDNVIVTDPQMKMTCEWLEANLPMQSGEHLTNIIATTNVVIDFTDNKGKKTHATGDKAVYIYQLIDGVTNETMTLTGNPPKLERNGGTMTADAIIWDRVGGVHTTGHFNFWQNTNAPVTTNGLTLGTNGVVSGLTNGMVMGTNTVETGTNLPASGTNGTNQPPAAK